MFVAALGAIEQGGSRNVYISYIFVCPFFCSIVSIFYLFSRARLAAQRQVSHVMPYRCERCTNQEMRRYMNSPQAKAGGMGPADVS